jgi:hypothetical protein
MKTDLDAAKVHEGGAPEHPTLFPMPETLASATSPRGICQHMGLNWLAACKLFDERLLSYDPRALKSLSETQAAELRFLGALVVAGCDDSMLKKMVSGLCAPYSYRLDRMYFDWQDQEWRLLPRADEFRDRFDRWLDELVEHGEGARLQSLEHSVRHAVGSLRSSLPW